MDGARQWSLAEAGPLPMLGLLAGLLLGLLCPPLLRLLRPPADTSKTPAPEALERHDLSLRPANVPRHLAVIMDGNRRYGSRVHGDPLKGHWDGGRTLTDFVQVPGSVLSPAS